MTGYPTIEVAIKIFLFSWAGTDDRREPCLQTAQILWQVPSPRERDQQVFCGDVFLRADVVNGIPQLIDKIDQVLDIEVNGHSSFQPIGENGSSYVLIVDILDQRTHGS